MHTYSERPAGRSSTFALNAGARKAAHPVPQFVDNRSESAALLKTQEAADNGPQGLKLRAYQRIADAKGRVAQPKWKNDSVTVGARHEMERQMGIPERFVDESKPAGQSLLDSAVFLVPPTPELKATLMNGGNLKAIKNDRHVLGESEHGATAWDEATKPWPYVTRMRERYRTFGKSDEGNIAAADKKLDDATGGTERAQTGDLALEGLSEYAVSALTVAQQLLKGYDAVFDKEGKEAAEGKETYIADLLLPRLIEARVVLLRFWGAGLNLASKTKRTDKEDLIVKLSQYVADHDGFKLLKTISKGGAKGEIIELGGFWQKHAGKKIQTMQDLIENATKRVITLEKFTNTKSIEDLNKGRDRDLTDWSKRANTAIEGAATRDIREHEMVRRINASPVPLFVQVGAAHIPGLQSKGAVGTHYQSELSFWVGSSKENEPDAFAGRMHEDSIKRRTMNLWG